MKNMLLRFWVLFALFFTIEGSALAEENQYNIEKPTSITHGQVIVFDQSNPKYLLWTDEHVAQGFGWLNGSNFLWCSRPRWLAACQVENSRRVPPINTRCKASY